MPHDEEAKLTWQRKGFMIAVLLLGALFLLGVLFI